MEATLSDRNEKRLLVKEERPKEEENCNSSKETSPQLFKQRPPKPRGRKNKKEKEKGAIKVNYDSDSIDMDVLSSLTSEKTMPPPATFTGLMEQPLSDACFAVKPNATLNFNSPAVVTPTNNAFSKLMMSASVNSKAKKDTNTGRKSPTDVLTEEASKKTSSKKRGRKKKVINPDSAIVQEECQKDTVKETSSLQTEEENSNGRRKSSRILRNRESMEKKRKEQEEIERLLDPESPVKRKRAKNNDVSSESRMKKRKKEDEKLSSEKIEIDMTSTTAGDSDEVIVDKIVISSAKPKESNKKLAPLFIRGKKANPLKVIEDPAKVAARKAFLLSSVPEKMRIQIDNSR